MVGTHNRHIYYCRYSRKKIRRRRRYYFSFLRTKQTPRVSYARRKVYGGGACWYTWESPPGLGENTYKVCGKRPSVINKYNTDAEEECKRSDDRCDRRSRLDVSSARTPSGHQDSRSPSRIKAVARTIATIKLVSSRNDPCTL